MSTLHLKIREGCQEPYVEFYVDGEDLGQRVKESLAAAGFDDVLPWHGGDYSIDETVLGEPARKQGADNAILFACGCGHWACSGVFARVVVEGDAITICDIHTWRGDQRVVAPLPPISFERRQFDEAVRQLERDIEAWRPAATKSSGGGESNSGPPPLITPP